MPCISLWYNSCAIDTRERYIVKIVFEVNGKKVPLKSLKYISKKDQLEVMKNWFFENFGKVRISRSFLPKLTR